MFALDFLIDPSFECADNDARDVAFVRATSSMGDLRYHLFFRRRPFLAHCVFRGVSFFIGGLF
jgi:hypothetical protein